MMNDQEAISRRLLDPAFLMRLVQNAGRVNLVLAFGLLGYTALQLWAFTHPPKPLIIYTQRDGRPYRTYPLSQPIMSDRKVLDWTVRTVVKAYAVNYLNYRVKFTEVSHRFTPHGWGTFAEDFVGKGDLAKLKAAKMVGQAKPLAAAIIRDQEVVGNRYTYLITFPLYVRYENQDRMISEHVNIRALVVRVPVVDHPDGIAIAQLNAVPQ